MMAELEIDQSNLPRVQEVCQCFAVLEDGALAHNLQEQEIEQYYTTNVQKNQLVQNDIRVAKRLQDEEEEERAQQSTLLRQASRQLPTESVMNGGCSKVLLWASDVSAGPRDGCMSKEIAKRMQDEETQSLSRVSRGQEGQRQVLLKMIFNVCVRSPLPPFSVDVVIERVPMRPLVSPGGAPRQPEPGEQSLDMGELRQVLQDEELALELQEDEDRRRRRKSHPSPCSFYPEGDFRVAQVAQDEEIARFMQKQEVKAKRRSRELEGSSSWREPRAPGGGHDRRAARDGPVQRERLDSEGLPSPAEDRSPEDRPPSPSSTPPEARHVRNVAEELDPTFQARRRSTGSLGGGPAGPTCQSLPRPQAGLHNLLEEATFIPPTKRQTDKSGRAKPKEKNCKQQ
ncbi:Coiled-coil domain-containing protein 50 [Liparis tanakae]|uniref:Coiled-coil domain-containing protein 50 n=1 Tax=Liparis tanakae TaxID=230148 RepID=A0A4Z2IBM3_9TELE|nr:Coiled-coil domain-containing protein 50 [Liparis tanakae]